MTKLSQCNYYYLEGHKYLIISYRDDFRWYTTQDCEKSNLDQHDVNLTSFRQIEKSEQRSVIKFFFLKGLAAKTIHRELTTVLGSTAYSLSQVKEWRARFATGKLSCQDEFRPGRPPHVLGKALSDFLEEFPFATAGVIAQNFGQSKHTIKEILQQELGLWRFSRK
jgi:transposase